MPLLSQITKDAINSEDNFIITSFRTDEAPYFKSASFSKTKYDNWALPEKRYTNLIDRAKKETKLNIYANCKKQLLMYLKIMPTKKTILDCLVWKHLIFGLTNTLKLKI